VIGAFIKTHKLLVAILSLLGSVAGVAFSASDVQDELAKREKRKKLTTTKF
jgi:hypothetical protein